VLPSWRTTFEIKVQWLDRALLHSVHVQTPPLVMMSVLVLAVATLQSARLPTQFRLASHFGDHMVLQRSRCEGAQCTDTGATVSGFGKCC
jgi:hypothetical protein